MRLAGALIGSSVTAVLGVACSYDWSVGPREMPVDGGADARPDAAVVADADADVDPRTPNLCQGTCACPPTQSCILECGDARPCEAVCGTSTSPCDVRCKTGACAVRCESSSTCNVDCASGLCTVECGTGATCRVSCPGGGCKTTCASSATCFTEGCTNGTCSCNSTGGACR